MSEKMKWQRPELLLRLREHIEIIVSGEKHDGSWMRPIHISHEEKFRHGQEALAIVDKLLEEKVEEDKG